MSVSGALCRWVYADVLYLWQHRLLSTQICILDLGGVVEESEDGNEGTVGAVGYRAPEITLGKCS